MISRDWGDLEERYAENLHAASLRELRGRPIAIIGFMGAGKTTVGSLLAARLDRPFFDSDPYLEQVAGRTIDSFFASGQEAAFRDLEASCIRDLVARPPSVIALGGGAFLRAETRELLLREALVVHLYVSWSTVKGYLGPIVDTRPLLRGRSLSQIHALYLSRQATYRKAHIRISAPRGGPEPVVDRILLALGGHLDSQA